MIANASPDDLSRQVRAAASAASDRARYVVAASKQLKDEGNALFKAGKHAEALEKYDRAIANVSSEEVGSSAAADVPLAAKALRRACLLNSAAAALGAECWSRAIEAASAALAEDPGNAKALFRRGMARAGEAKGAGGGKDALAAAAADLRAAASAAEGTADEPTIREKLSEVEASLRGGSDADPASAASSSAEAAVEAAAAMVKAEDAARRVAAEKRASEEKAAAAATMGSGSAAANPFAAAAPGPSSSVPGGAPDPSQLRAMAAAMRADPSLGEKMSSAARAMTPEQLRAAAAAQGLPAEAQATLSPDALSAAGTAMAAMKPEDLERMADAVEAAGKGGGGGASAGAGGSGGGPAVNGLFGGGAGSLDPSNPAAAAAAMLKDPAALRQATAMVKGLRPEQLAALSGGKIDAAQAEKLVKTLDGMSEEKIAMMLSASARFADWIRRGKEFKEKYLTRPVVVALVVVVVAVLMKRAGWF
jgi:hypothetical protein